MKERSDDSALAATRIAEEIKLLIARGEVAPGSPVTEKRLTEQFATSRTTARQAIALLISERYLDQEPYRSARVRTYTEEEIAHVIEVRQLIETHAAEHCAEATREGKARLREAFADYVSATSKGQVGAGALAHAELHASIAGLTGNTEFLRIERELMIGSMLLVDVINLRREDPEKMYLAHLRIVEALLKPDPKRARELVRTHLGMVLKAANEEMFPA